MKLAGHIGHGPNSSCPDLCPDMSCCHGIVTENVLKNGQMNVRIVKSQEEMALKLSVRSLEIEKLEFRLYLYISKQALVLQA